MIPKIIHQTAPKEQEKWHPVWYPCQESWKKQFPESEYQHILWTDEDVDELIQNHYPQYWEQYSKLTPHILKIDLSRFFILHHCGGIYADMDMFCYKNFYDNIKDYELILVESNTCDEIYQNSLMCSFQNHQFFIDCIKESLHRMNVVGPFELYNKKTKGNHNLIRVLTGPVLLTKISYQYQGIIKKLHKDLYNANIRHYHESIYVKHMLTGHWGDEIRSYLKKAKILSALELPMEEYKILDYNQLRNIDFKNFDFYKHIAPDQPQADLDIEKCSKPL